MYARVPTAAKRLADYEQVAGAQEIAALRDLAASLRGARVLHLTATAFGAGAPEELTALVPLMNDLGLDAEWQVVRGGGEFARVNKAIANALGGLKVGAVPPLLDVWMRYSAMNAGLFDGEYDFVVVHDPQPAGIRSLLEQAQGRPPLGKWIWRCHIDLTAAQPEVWRLLCSHLDCCYDGAIFAAAEYVRKDLDVPRVVVIPPAIDPLGAKNMEVDASTRRLIVERYGVDPRRPVICQIARFIKWSDPIGVIDAYRLAKKEVAGLQLILVWTMPAATAENWLHFQRVAAHAGNDQDIHLLSNLNEVGNVEQNVFQRASRLVVHRSQRKGFASTVAEASWKGRPVVAGRIGIMPGQVVDGHTGYVVDTIEQTADRIVRLLKDRPLGERMGRAGHEHVRRHFLITRALRDHLALFADLREGRTATAGA